MPVRVRIAPSPTGDPHVGTAYMALFNLIFARHHKGSFILRIEDTDQSRSRIQYEKKVMEALEWCGITWDEGPDRQGPFGPYRQSERLEIYRKHVDELVEQGKAYLCFTTSEELAEMRQIAKARGGRGGYDRRHRNLSSSQIEQFKKEGKSYVIRLKVPLTGQCEFEDTVKGKMTYPWADIDDQVLLKSDGFPTYHLANVVDDHLMQISHVIRGDEWISSTPKHLLLYEAFGWEAPTFIHMPLLLGIDGKKLSKRKSPTSILYYRDCGYLADAFTNFLTHMGYSMPDDKEVYSLDEIIKQFDEKRIGRSSAIFDIQKLNWLNQKYILNHIPEDHLWEHIKEWSFNDQFMKKLMPLVHTRISTFGDFMKWCSFFFVNELPLTPEKLCPKNLNPTTSAMILQTLIWKLDQREDWGSLALNESSRELATLFNASHKKIIMPILFVTITGEKQGPPLFDSVEILGKDRTKARFLKAIETLGGLSNKKLDLLQKALNQGDLSSLIEENK